MLCPRETVVERLSTSALPLWECPGLGTKGQFVHWQGSWWESHRVQQRQQHPAAQPALG